MRPWIIVTLALATALPASAKPKSRPAVPPVPDNEGERIVAYTEPGDLPRFRVGEDGETLELPLKHTHVEARITGHVAEVEITQEYVNNLGHPVEAIYVFPLPENSAVHRMRIEIGARVIESEIHEREEAKQIYEDAKQEGYTTALLEQERPNVFTQSVANIAPKKKIRVSINYVQTLTYDQGEYEFVFPMVVGPRFIPGSPIGSSGGGYSPDTDRVRDASRITPAVVGRGVRTGHDISLELMVDAGFEISGWDCATHAVRQLPAPDGRLALMLEERDSIPNRDFVLRYHVAAPEPRAALLTHRSGAENHHIALVIQPPDLDVEQLVGRREIIFVIDTSGSMQGPPLAMCKEAMAGAIAGLRPVDTFNVIVFSGSTGQLFESPRPANDHNTRLAAEFVAGLRAAGPTLMAKGVDAALSPAGDPGQHRYVFFMTDGYTGEEEEIIAGTRRLVAALEQQDRRAQVFSFGAGAAVNRHLLDGIAQAGKGLAVYSTTREDPYHAVSSFYRVIDHPVLTDIEIDWKGAQVSEVFPADPPDLFATRPLILHGKLRGRGPIEIEIHGRMDGRPVSIPVRAALTANQGRSVLDALWARAKIDWLEREILYNGYGWDQRTVDQITQLGLDYHLVTAYTSLVAVDRSRKVKGKAETIHQPVETPEGVDPFMAGAGVVDLGAMYTSPQCPPGQCMYKRKGQLKSQIYPNYGKRIDILKKETGVLRRKATQDTSRKHKLHTGALPAVPDPLGREEVKEVFRDQLRALRACAAATLAASSSLNTKIKVELIVDGRGTVRRVRFLESDLPEEVERCLEHILSRLVFRAFGGEPLRITYPLDLGPEG